jgi:hypothetical protein
MAEEKLHEMPFRIALRQEGEKWNAYLAPADTMDNPFFLGSMRLSIAKNNPAAKEVFMGLMQSIVVDAIKEVVGMTPVMVIRDAPSEERQQ